MLRRIGAVELLSPGRKLLYNQNLFSVVAPRYDLVTQLLSFGRDRSWKRRLVALLPRFDHPVALDLACGTGDIAFLLTDRYPEGEVTGLDLTAEMLTRARIRARRRETRRDGGPGTHLRFVQGDMNALPWRDNSVDIVTGGYALRNAPDLENTLGEIFRVLRPGGIAAFLEFSFVPFRGLRGAQLAVLRFWGQLWGILLHGDPEVYAYIARSLERYPDRDTLEQILSRRGYRVLHGRTLMLGFARITRVAKPIS